MKTYVHFCILTLVFVALCSSALAAINWIEKPAARLKIPQSAMFSWGENGKQGTVECRYKLDCPGDWLGGIQYAINKWSDWGKHSSVRYDNFVKEGSYVFTVEYKNANGRTKKLIRRFKVYFEYPEVVNDKVEINWKYVNSASTKKEKYKRLASEYRTAHQYWMEKYDYERKILKISVSPSELVGVGSDAIVGKGQGMLLRWADKGVAGTASKILAPKLLYDIGKQLGVDMFLIYQNVKANRAAQNAIFTYYAAEFYQKKGK